MAYGIVNVPGAFREEIEALASALADANARLDALSARAIFPAEASYASGELALTMDGAPASGTYTAQFTAPADFADGDTLTIDGTAYALQSAAGEALSAGAWVSGAVITINVDADGKTAYFGGGGGGSYVPVFG